jgi:hypothetical protein
VKKDPVLFPTYVTISTVIWKIFGTRVGTFLAATEEEATIESPGTKITFLHDLYAQNFWED